ncbi:hypothetical protein [Gynuella sp.]|uniref:hypothetical protein n=1 Tax=Gynuella sp. TaxID=2969146 RepID=UPI003D10ED11
MRLIVIFMLLFFAATSAQSHNFEIRDGKLYYKNIAADTAFKITQDSIKADTEGGTLFQEIEDDHVGFNLFKIISREGRTEIWIYFKSLPKSIRKLDSLSTDMAMTILSDQYIKLERKHMGSSISFIYKLDNQGNIEKSRALEDLIYFDENDELIVKLIYSGVNKSGFEYSLGFSKLFSEEKLNVPIKYHTERLSDALGYIVKITRSKCTLNMEYKIGEKNEYEEVEIPEKICEIKG